MVLLSNETNTGPTILSFPASIPTWKKVTTKQGECFAFIKPCLIPKTTKENFEKDQLTKEALQKPKILEGCLGATSSEKSQLEK